MEAELIGEGRRAEILAWHNGTVLKLYRDPAEVDAATEEARATSAAHAAGAPAPRCFGTAAFGERTGVILERLSGPVLVDEILNGDATKAVVDLATLLATIHRCRSTESRSVLPGLARRIGSALPPEKSARIVERMRELGDAPTLLHTDLHVLNAVRNSRGRAIAIDWDTLFHGPPLYDVARSLYLLVEADAGDAIEPTDGLQSFRRQGGAIFLETYGASAAIDGAELAAWRLPVLAARLTEEIAEERDYLHREIHISLGD